MNFAQQAAATKRKAPRVFTLRPEHFADTWQGQRPAAAIDLGLRVPSEQDIFNAQLEANRLSEGHPDQELVRTSKLLAFVVSRGICSPHDVSEPHPYFELPEDQVPVRLRSDTIKRIFDEIERLIVEQSPVFGEADDTETKELGELLLTDDPFAGMPAASASRVRRYLLFALEILRNET